MDGFLETDNWKDSSSYQGNQSDNLNDYSDLEWMSNFDPTHFRETIATDLLMIYKNSGSIKDEPNDDETSWLEGEIPDDFPTYRTPTPPIHKAPHFSTVNSLVHVKPSAKIPSFAHSNLASHHGRMGLNEPTMVKEESQSDEKPIWTYSQLITLALKTSPNGMVVNDIYEYICDNFPYFRTASQSWKNSVRHTLSTNKNIEKRQMKHGLNGRNQCRWVIRPDKMEKIDAELSFARVKQEAIDKERMNIGKRIAVPSQVKYGFSTGGVHYYAYPSKHTQMTIQRVKKEKLDGDYENLDPKRIKVSAPSTFNGSIAGRNYVYKPRVNNQFSIARMKQHTAEQNNDNADKVHSKQSLKIAKPSDQVGHTPAAGAPKYVYKPRAPQSAQKFGGVSFKPAAGIIAKSNFLTTVSKALPSILRKRPIAAVIPEPVPQSATTDSSTAKFAWDHCYGQKSPLKSPSSAESNTPSQDSSNPLIASLSSWNNSYDLNSFSPLKPISSRVNDYDSNRLDMLDMVSPFKSPSKNDKFVSDRSESRSPNENNLLYLSPNLGPLTTIPIDFYDNYSHESNQDPGLYPLNPDSDSISDFHVGNSANPLEDLYNFDV